METEYPFSLINGKPFMQIEGIRAVVSWSQGYEYGTSKPFTVNGELIEPMIVTEDSAYNPDFYTKHYGTQTDVVLGSGVFCCDPYTIDLSKERVFFHRKNADVGVGKKAYQHDGLYAASSVDVRVLGKEALLDLDIGNELSVLPQEILESEKPVEEKSVYIFENDPYPTTVKVYEVSMRLSYAVTLLVRARCITPREVDVYQKRNTQGCLGVDLIRNHAVTFITNEYDKRVKRYKSVMYFNEFR